MELEERINRCRAELSENDMIVWEYIQRNRHICERLSINELGDRCHVSRTTVLRFSQKIGFAGYGELKLRLKLENERRKQDAGVSNMERVRAAYNRVIDEMMAMDCDSLFQRMDQADNVYIFGSGMVQSAVSKELHRIFLAADKLFYPINGGTEVNTLLANVTPRDLVILLSVSGESEHVLRLAQALRVRRIPTLSITKLRENTLAQLCDFKLYISTAMLHPAFPAGSYESTAGFFILTEMLFLKYLSYRERMGIQDEAGNPD